MSRHNRIAVSVASGLLTLATAGLLWGQSATTGTQAATKPAVKVKPSSQPKDLTDEQVHQAIMKGVDYLLSQRKGDSFESGKYATGVGHEGQHKGGETALVVYALLHVGQSVEDQRLGFKSPELAPAIKYLCELNPAGTYVAGLQASALSLVPRRPETEAGLDRAKNYILTAMGQDGGYDYGNPRGAQIRKLEDAQNKLKNAQKLLAEARSSGQKPDFIKTLSDDITKAKDDLKKAEAEMVKYRGVKVADRQKELNDKKKQLAEKTAKLAEMSKEKPPKSDDPAFKAELGKLKWEIEDLKEGTTTLTRQIGVGFLPTGDLSNGQYGTLGAWALEDANIDLPTSYWSTSDTFWRLMQKPNGTWPYRHDGTNIRDSMGVAGIASLFITWDMTDRTVRLEPKEDKNLELGLAWLRNSFKADTPDFYYLYGVERVGLASGLKFFGTTNWYKEGAKNIIKRQAADGSWDGGFWGSSKLVTTSYALLFLARGRNPVVFNKLEYNGPWYARPRDNANLTHWMSKAFERPINWQTVNLQVKPEEWLDAPLLLITGSKDPGFTPEDLAKLKAYVNAGGIIFSSSDGATPEFTNAIRKYASQITDNKYEMRVLPKDHYIFDLWQKVDEPPEILSLSNGAREVWVHSTGDMGASWQKKAFSTKEHFVTPSNLYFYATGRGSLRTKLQTLVVTPSSDKSIRSVSMARVSYASNWDPEPGAWPRMAALAQADFRTDLKLSTVALKDLDAKKTPLAHMTGTTQFSIAPSDIDALRNYLNQGGTLLVDSTGGGPGFNQSFIEMIKKVLPEAALDPIPLDHEIYNGSISGSNDLRQVEYRKYAQIKLRPGDAPRLLGMKLKDRYVVIFSPEDITSGLLGTNTWGIIGYTPDTCENIVQNVLLYVSPHTATTKPATMSAK